MMKRKRVPEDEEATLADDILDEVEDEAVDIEEPEGIEGSDSLQKHQMKRKKKREGRRR